MTTHGEARCVQACEIITLSNSECPSDRESFLKTTLANYLLFTNDCYLEIRAITECEFFSKSRDSINGSGYVIASLDTAHRCFQNSDTFEDGSLLAANFGDDADTTAVIFGQFVGAYNGVSGISSK
ncbi:TPA: ADP-ribosylglycohydrolase family protein [Photobacterium damselae]